jgi:hypothetical protein
MAGRNLAGHQSRNFIWVWSLCHNNAQGKFPLKKSRQKQGCLKPRLRRTRITHVVWFPDSAPRDGRSFASDFCDDAEKSGVPRRCQQCERLACEAVENLFVLCEGPQT